MSAMTSPPSSRSTCSRIRSPSSSPSSSASSRWYRCGATVSQPSAASPLDHVADGVGHPAGLVQHDDPAADRTDRFRDGQPQGAAVHEGNGFGPDVAHRAPCASITSAVALDLARTGRRRRSRRVGGYRVGYGARFVRDLDSLPAYVPGRAIPGPSNWPATRCRCPRRRGCWPRSPRPRRSATATRTCPSPASPPGSPDEFGIDPARIAVGCGSVSLCQQLVAITCREPGDEVVYAWRSFESYPIVTQIQGARRSGTVPLDAQFRHDLDAMAAAVTPRTRLVFVCTPNNPTGTAVRSRRVRALPAGGRSGRARRARRGLPRVRDRSRRRRRRDPARRAPQPRRAAHLLEGLPARRPPGGLRAGDAGGGAGAAKGRLAVRRERGGPGGGARRPRLPRRAAGRVRRGGGRARAGARRAAPRGLHRAAVAGQLRLGGARRADGGVRGALPRPEGGGAPVPLRRACGSRSRRREENDALLAAALSFER